MSLWWDGLSILEQGLFIVAAPSTLILLIQTVMLVFGGGGDMPDSDLPSDVSGLDLDTDMDAGMGADMSGVDMGGSGDGADHFESSGLRIFSIRGIMAFLTVGSWSGIVAMEYGAGELTALLIAFVLGFAALLLIAKLIQLLMKLQSIPVSNYKSALGQVGEVYMRIPPAGKGTGKVSIYVNGQFGVFDAVNDTEKMLKTGESIRVVDVTPGGTMVVAPADSEE